MSNTGVRKRQHVRKDGTISTTYLARLSYRDGDGNRRWDTSRSFRTRREAEAEYIRMRATRESGTYTPPSSMTVAEYVEEHWLPSVKARVKRSTFDGYNNVWTRHVRQDLGGLRLQRLATTQIDALYRKLGEGHTVKVTTAEGSEVKEARAGLKPKTIRNVHLVISKALSDAVDAGLISASPAERAKPPKVVRLPEDEVKAWTQDELKAFLAHVEDDHWHPVLRVAAMTGMRRGEVLGLRWRDLDFVKGTLTVRQTLLTSGYKVYFDTPKNHRPRAIDLDARTLTILRAHRSHQHEARLLAGEDYLASDLVFTNDDGSLIHPDSYSQAFDRLSAQVAGLTRIALKDVRHTHATLLLKQGVSIKVVSERLGHSDPAFTLRIYAHVLPTMQAEAAAGLSALIDEPGPSVTVTRRTTEAALAS